MFISKVRTRISHEHQTKLEGICSSTQWLVFVLFLTYSLARSDKQNYFCACSVAGNTDRTRLFHLHMTSFIYWVRYSLWRVFWHYPQQMVYKYFWLNNFWHVGFIHCHKTVPSCYNIHTYMYLFYNCWCNQSEVVPYLLKLMIRVGHVQTADVVLYMLLVNKAICIFAFQSYFWQVSEFFWVTYIPEVCFSLQII